MPEDIKQTKNNEANNQEKSPEVSANFFSEKNNSQKFEDSHLTEKAPETKNSNMINYVSPAFRIDYAKNDQKKSDVPDTETSTATAIPSQAAGSAESQPSQPSAYPTASQESVSLSQNTPLTDSQPKTSGKRKIFIVLGIVAVFLLITGGFAFGYFFFFQSPEKIIEQSLAKLIEAKNFSYSGSLEFSEIKSTGLDNSGKLVFDGSFDKTNDQEKKSLFSAKINLATPGSPKESSAQLDAMSKGNIFYFKFSNFSGSNPPMDIRPYENKWIKLDPESIKKIAEENLSMSDDSLKNKFEEQDAGKLTDDQAAKIKEAFQKSSIIKVTKKLPSEKVNGTDSYHYQFEIDREKIKQLLAKIDKIKGNEGDQGGKTENMYDYLDKSAESSLKSSEMEIWIGKWNKLPQKIKIQAKNDQTQATFLFNFSKYGISFDVKEPESSVPLEELIFGSLNQAKAKATVASFKATIVSANPAAMTCADESIISGGDTGSPICASKDTYFDDNWPKTATGVCSNNLKYIVNDAITADGKYSFAASCQSPVDNEKTLVVCSENGCDYSGMASQSADADSDNLADDLENTFGSKPDNPDTDGDGYKDGDELMNGYNPLVKGQ